MRVAKAKPETRAAATATATITPVLSDERVAEFNEDEDDVEVNTALVIVAISIVMAAEAVAVETIDGGLGVDEGEFELRQLLSPESPTIITFDDPPRRF